MPGTIDSWLGGFIQPGGLLSCRMQACRKSASRHFNNVGFSDQSRFRHAPAIASRGIDIEMKDSTGIMAWNLLFLL